MQLNWLWEGWFQDLDIEIPTELAMSISLRCFLIPTSAKKKTALCYTSVQTFVHRCHYCPLQSMTICVMADFYAGPVCRWAVPWRAAYSGHVTIPTGGEQGPPRSRDSAVWRHCPRRRHRERLIRRPTGSLQTTAGGRQTAL